MSSATSPFDPLTEDERQELDDFLLYEVKSDEAMTLDCMDGYLHAIAIGPTSLQPKQWLPVIWGETKNLMPPMATIEKLNHILGLVMRHFNGIIAGLEEEPCEIYPLWCTQEYRGHEYDDAEGWAMGFVDGMNLCQSDWKPLLDTPQGSAWYRPIGLLGEEDFGPDQDKLTKTPAMRSKLALQIPESVVAMYQHWLPLRLAIYERNVAEVMKMKVGRNEACPCGSGKKFKKCCGAAADLH
jgi:uncharacterized protein